MDMSNIKHNSEHIAEICKRSDFVEFEVALGYQPEEGVWYGNGSQEDPAAQEKRKPKRSFSFGRRPAH